MLAKPPILRRLHVGAKNLGRHGTQTATLGLGGGLANSAVYNPGLRRDADGAPAPPNVEQNLSNVENKLPNVGQNCPQRPLFHPPPSNRSCPMSEHDRAPIQCRTKNAMSKNNCQMSKFKAQPQAIPSFGSRGLGGYGATKHPDEQKCGRKVD